MSALWKCELWNFTINVETLQDFAKSSLILEITWESFYLIFRLFLSVSAFLGFGFYLWFLSTSDEQTQRRLLNILNGYLSGVCMVFCPVLFITYYADDEQFKLCFRIAVPFFIAISIIFLLISCATLLNHFKPDAYLEFSLQWKHKIAIPILLFSFIFTEELAYRSCPEFVECQATKIRSFLVFPACVTSLLCQLIVIIDVSCGWKYIYRTLRGLFNPNLVISLSDGDIEMMSFPASASHQHPNPTQLLDQHLVSS